MRGFDNLEEKGFDVRQPVTQLGQDEGRQWRGKRGRGIEIHTYVATRIISFPTHYLQDGIILHSVCDPRYVDCVFVGS